jgi:hypothetical protein
MKNPMKTDKQMLPQQAGGVTAMTPPAKCNRLRMQYALSRCVFFGLCLCFAAVAAAGPYTEGGINGYIGADRRHANPLDDPDARINPIFRGWATSVVDYLPSDEVWFGDWNHPEKALGRVTGDNFDIVSLGDLDEAEIAAGKAPGQITLVFGDPCNPADSNHIRNGRGYDFVVFENGFLSRHDTGGGSVYGQMIAELAYVEVSSNGRDFARFAAVSLTAAGVGPYGTIEISNVLNLAGKHPNAYGTCTGTPFDLSELLGHPLVAAEIVDINNISYVRIVDIPGSGDFNDSAGEYIDPITWPSWRNYDSNHPVYDAWLTEGSGGFDLEAVGVLKEQEYSADINLDGIVDAADLALFASAWQSHFGSVNWIGRCDLDGSGDLLVDGRDLAAFVAQWLGRESWYAE